ncbi:unnamed protein product [marine sediment metagenome]|uniref:Uncharacterized protein n=1 Tax=marine sediment metagenome TaxID=412755 RepID=X1CRJ2_9ZZZZ
MKQFNVELTQSLKKYWSKILKYFVIVTIIANGLCALFGHWSFMFFYFSTFISFSVIFLLFMLFYKPELTIHSEDY